MRSRRSSRHAKICSIVKTDDPDAVRQFVASMLRPKVDAHIFEIASFAILKEYFANQSNLLGPDTRRSLGGVLTAVQDGAMQRE